MIVGHRAPAQSPAAMLRWREEWHTVAAGCNLRQQTGSSPPQPNTHPDTVLNSWFRIWEIPNKVNFSEKVQKGLYNKIAFAKVFNN